jgi:alpha-D-ribose 1-methylphosphonate 5-triphosphate synthase subunit PhnI
MGYVAVKGGAEAIEASIERLKYERLRKGRTLDAGAVEAGMRALVDQVMSESSLYDEAMAALSIKQAEGSPEEAVFLMRAFRSTLPRSHYSLAIDSRAMRVERRISASFKDIPGGQILGASCDYTHRLIDSGLLEETDEESARWLSDYLRRDTGAVDQVGAGPAPMSAIDYVRSLGLLKARPADDAEPKDVTKRAIEFPASRSERLQILARGQTGAVTALGYAALRGYGATLHPTVGELRVGRVAVYAPNPFASAGAGSDGDAAKDSYYVGEIRITAVETLVPVPIRRGLGRTEIGFELGFGLSFGQNETKAIAMSLLDQCLESGDKRSAVQDEEFVLLHVDSVEATGFISHLKLPHYVTFQSKLDSVRRARGAG